ncbi:MAG TPA: alpha-galactosidase [Streptosporangiaceae bacterium]|nr:alpha-galactosidase [Streptosporangiaceae bacterium]
MPAIEHDPATDTWLLTTPETAYAFRVEPGGELRHLYWGARLTLPQALAAGRDRPPVFGFDSPWDGTEELPAEGGLRFGVPSLQVRFADGTRAVEWLPDGAATDEDGGQCRLEIRLRDRSYPLGTVLEYRVFDDCDVIERRVTLVHLGDGEPIEVYRADSAAWVLPPLAGYRVSYTTGRWSGETRLRRHELPAGELTLTSRRGITSHHVNPWVMLDDGTAAETAGEVRSVALAWSGSWRITASRTADDRVSVTGGFGHDGARWTLAPGESLTTPVFAGLYTSAGFGAASRGWHAYIRAHVLPRPEETRPVLFNSWEATGFDVCEQNQLELAKAAAAIGVELFVVDDGWFGTRTHDGRALGDWTPNPERFPHGLRPLASAVHDLGMKFGIWVEPEMVNPDSELYRAHPDWVLHFPNRRRTESRNQLVLNFARPEVAAWAHGWLDELIGANDIDFIKWDMNRPFSEAGWPDAPGDAERLWIDHVRAVYAIMERLRTDHPGLRIESCSGGGGRADLGIMAHTDQTWISDNTDALDRIMIQDGYAHLYPPGTMSAWVTDSPNNLTGRRIPLRFRFHVAMAGVLGIGGNLLNWTDAELSEASALIAVYKDVRKVVQHGSLYRLAPLDPEVTAVQYVAGNRAVVLAWRPAPRYGQPARPIRLAGLDPASSYRVEGRDYPGIALLTRGLPTDFPAGDYGSMLAILDKVQK